MRAQYTQEFDVGGLADGPPEDMRRCLLVRVSRIIFSVLTHSDRYFSQ